MTDGADKKERRSISFLEMLMLAVLIAVLCGLIHQTTRKPQDADDGSRPDQRSEELNTQGQNPDLTDADSEESPTFKAGIQAMTLPTAAGTHPTVAPATSTDMPVSFAVSATSRRGATPETSTQPITNEEALAYLRQEADSESATNASEWLSANESLSSNTNRSIRAEIEAELRRIAEMEWGPEAEGKLQDTMALWASIDPAAALEYAMNIESRRTSVAAADTVLTKWAQRDPQAAFEWYMQNRSAFPEKLDSAVGNLFSQMAHANLESALGRLKDLPTDSLRNKALRAIINQYVARGEASRLELYFNSQGDTAALSMLASAQIENIALYKPEAAAAWIATLTDPVIRVKAINTLIDKWGYDNPAQAAQWVAGLPRDEYWSEFAARMTKIWARDFPDSAATWLLSLSPPAPQLDTAIQTLVSIVMKANPAGAMAWAHVITDLNKRHNLMQRAGYLWLKKDPIPATAYILNSDLPDAIKNKLLGKSHSISDFRFRISD